MTRRGHGREPTAGPGEAFEVAERARARLLLEILAERGGGAPESEAERLRARLRERYAALENSPTARRVRRAGILKVDPP